MKIDIYTSTKNGSKYLSVAKGTNPSELTLSDSIDNDLRHLSPFRTRLEVERGKEHPALDQEDVITQIETQGYAVHTAKSFITLG